MTVNTKEVEAEVIMIKCLCPVTGCNGELEADNSITVWTGGSSTYSIPHRCNTCYSGHNLEVSYPRYEFREKK